MVAGLDAQEAGISALCGISFEPYSKPYVSCRSWRAQTARLGTFTPNPADSAKSGRKKFQKFFSAQNTAREHSGGSMPPYPPKTRQHGALVPILHWCIETFTLKQREPVDNARLRPAQLTSNYSSGFQRHPAARQIGPGSSPRCTPQCARRLSAIYAPSGRVNASRVGGFMSW